VGGFKKSGFITTPCLQIKEKKIAGISSKSQGFSGSGTNLFSTEAAGKGAEAINLEEFRMRNSSYAMYFKNKFFS
jgi:hypothetical protein